VHRAATLRDDARPRDREAERVDAELLHQLHVARVAVVEVARDRAGVAAAHLAGRRGEAIPHALAAAVLVGGAFDLIRRRRGAPDEVGGERVDSGGGHVFLDSVRGGCYVAACGLAMPASTSRGVMTEQTGTAS